MMISKSRLILGILLFWLHLLCEEVRAQQYGGVFGIENSLSPRYYAGLEHPRLQGRDSGVCESNSHSCQDINATVCCLNTQYCILSPDFSAQCCQIGSNCDSPCPSSSYLCNTTLTISSTPTTTTTCCPRACPTTSQYQCPSSLGGGCCAYTASCISGGCAVTIAPSSSVTPDVDIVPSGCSTGDIACPSSEGGGCCGQGFSCVVVGGERYCAAGGTGGGLSETRGGALATSSSSSSSNSSSHGGGLSTGAKAGIGIGVSIISLSILGFLLCFWRLQRRRANLKNQTANTNPNSNPEIAYSQGGSHSSKRPSPNMIMRQGSDYFTQNQTQKKAQPNGPYAYDSSATTTPGMGPNRGVPAMPQSPNDIVGAVEIGPGLGSNATSPGWGVDEELKMRGVREGVVELE